MNNDELEGIATDYVAVLSSNIDNMDGEMLGGVMERLFELGAFDVSYTPIYMKKNRPATMLTLMCSLEKEGIFVNALLRETTTLGVRVEHIQRYIADREQQTIETPLGSVLVKVKRLKGQVVGARAEFEECQRIAHERNLPLLDVYRVLSESVQQHFPAAIIGESEHL